MSVVAAAVIEAETAETVVEVVEAAIVAAILASLPVKKFCFRTRRWKRG